MATKPQDGCIGGGIACQRQERELCQWRQAHTDKEFQSRPLGHLQYQRQYLNSGRQPERCSVLTQSPRVDLLGLHPVQNMLSLVSPG